MRLLILLSTLLAVNAIDWLSIEEATKAAKQNEKLVLFLMTKESCKPCKKLLASLDESKEFNELKEQFVLAKAADDNLPKDTKFNLDGKYVPKLVFLDGNGVVFSDIVNQDAKSAKAKYFYKQADHVVKSMNAALAKGFQDNGFGKDYVWYDWENGLKAAKDQLKPILLIFHQDWCGACKRLKPKFADASEVKELADKFVMINTDSETVINDPKYKADGEYYPKILFLDEFGELYDDEWNHGTKHAHVLHYYGEGVEIAASMTRILTNRTEREKIEDNGFGKHIKWVKYEEGKKLALEQSKPLMLIIHKTYCGACQALKPRLKADAEFSELSKSFVMVNCKDDEEPNEDQFDIDGAYIPRIFFLDHLGKVEPSIKNEGKDYEKAQYAYGSAKSITGAMKKALEMKLGERREVVTTGFGNEYMWHPYADGLRYAKKVAKPVMLVFYNDYCQFAKYMMQQFRESKEMIELAKKFVMIKLNEEEAKESDPDKFDVDGKYTPRIFFMDPDQNLRTDINNTESQYKTTLFYYGKTEDILTGMQQAMEKINITLGNGFGEYIEWKRFEHALELSQESKMPIMVIIHKSWCGACTSLKPKIQNSRTIWKLSYYFNMVNVEDQDEPLDEQYFIDGGYYPRIYFLDHTGKVHHDMHNRDPAFLKYKFSYQEEEQIVISMKWAISKLSIYPLPTNDPDVPMTGSTTASTTTGTTPQQQPAQNIDLSKLSAGKRIIAEAGIRTVTIDEALVETKQTNKPIMFIIHRTTCPSCKAVLKMIARDEKFKQRLNDFVVADIEDDVDEDKADSYDVDGAYVPRIYFLDSEGKIIKDIWNVGTNYMENKFYYYEIIGIANSMDKALEAARASNEKSEENTEETKSETTEENKTENSEEKKEEKSEEKKEDAKKEEL